MKKSTFFGLFSTLLFMFLAVASLIHGGEDPLEEWIVRYDGTANSTDQVFAMAVDSSGNVYVTGGDTGIGRSRNACTIKYDRNGNQEWISRYNGPGNSPAGTGAIAIDPAGNVYVTGFDFGIGTSRDYATIKYDKRGNQLWAARYDGPGHSQDWTEAIAVDPSGDVYVTGYSTGSGTFNDYATIRYDRNGNQLWVARYDGPANSYDSASAIAIDPTGDVYVTGYSTGIGTDYDYVTIKYDRDGNQLWDARYNGPANSYDYAYAIAIDPSGDIYVTGSSTGIGMSSDYATIKYDRNGDELWVETYNGPANFSDGASAIAIDHFGDVYVTGFSTGSDMFYDYATIKYDRNGNELWVATYDGPADSYFGAGAIVIDYSGDIYVTGSTGSWMSSDYATIKYDRNGNERWVAIYNGPADSSDQSVAIATDPTGAVYVAGSSAGIGTGSDYATIKYSKQSGKNLKQ